MIPEDYGERHVRGAGSRYARLGALAFFAVLAGMAAQTFVRLAGGYTAAIAAAALGAPVCAWAAWKALLAARPGFLFRAVKWAARHCYYRLNVMGAEEVPEEGGALLLANHVTVFDFMVIALACPRPVRFVMYEEYYEDPLVKLAAKHMDFIHARRKDSARKLAVCFRHAREALDRGEVVCMFPEGGVTRTGFIGKFLNGYEHVLRHSAHPVIPVHLDWRRRGLYAQPNGFHAPGGGWRTYRTVTVSFGEALPAGTRPGKVRDAVHNLSAAAFEKRKASYVPLHHMFVHQAKRLGGRLLFADTTGKSVTYRKALISSIALAGLVKRKCAGEDAVGIMLPSTAACALLNIAVLMAGKKPIDLNFTATDDAVTSAVERSGIKTIFTSNAFLEKAKVRRRPGMVALEEAGKEIGTGAKLGAALKALILPGGMICRMYGGAVSAEDIATIIFSSGSTGVPKGVVLTHANIMSNMDSMSNVYPVKENDVICGILPLFHSFGFNVTMWFPVATGISVAYHPNPLDARTISEMAREWSCTLLLGTSTFCRAYVRGCEADDLGSIKTIICGAEKLKPEVAEAFEEKFGIRPMEGYGVTETSPVISLNVYPYRGAGMFQKGNVEGTTGRAVPGMATKTIDADSEEDLEFGERGILAVKGPSIMKGYLGDKERTGEVLKDGWYNTRDVAVIDAEGYIRLVDRVSRFSKIAGEMVPHLVVEEALAAVLGTDEMRAVVTGIPDSGKGERLVVVHLAFEESLEVVWERLNSSDLPPLYVPRADSFIEVEEIPLLGSGKVALRTLREIAMARLGAGRGGWAGPSE
ncbi:MAG: AMP-binding protein [Planctomycetes bacterium]|nr:AMP-binding protein [Planctomycetota bacterium]